MSTRKTRKEKVIARLHRKLSQTNLKNTPEDSSSVEKPTMYSFSNVSLVSHNTSAQTNPYFYTDLMKTITVTSVIIAIELVLFVLLNRNSFKIPMINF